MLSDELLPRVEATIRRHAMIIPGDGVVVACSGGPDSLALLHLLCKLRQVFNLSLTAVYVDHGLRPEAEAEGEFVIKQAASWGVPALARKVPVNLHEGPGSLQARARVERYRILMDVAASVHAERIALGHTADDQVETLAMRLVRGTGCHGLAGIPPVNGPVIRPILYVWRAETEAYCRENGLTPVRDPSNDTDAYARNRVRHHLIPVLEEYNRQAKKALISLAETARVEDEWMESCVTRFIATSVTPTDGGWWCSLEHFFSQPLAMQRRVIRALHRRLIGDPEQDVAELEFERVGTILDLLHKGSTGTSIPLSAATILWLERGGFWMGPDGNCAPFDIPVTLPGDTFIPHSSGLHLFTSFRGGGTLSVSELQYRSPQATQPWLAVPDGAMVDWEKISGPLSARNRRPGDRYQPLGLKGMKKLQDMFVDVGVPRRWRDRLPVITDNLGIVWVPGLRPAERVKVTPATKMALELKMVTGAAQG